MYTVKVNKYAPKIAKEVINVTDETLHVKFK